MKHINSSSYFPLFILWIVFFCFSVCMALIFQNAIVPNMLSISEGGKLLSNDAVIFHEYALKLAAKIEANGWSEWRLFPFPNMMGNVSILGAIYVVFGGDPSFAIPLNAALHAFSGVMIFFLISRASADRSIGVYAGILAGCLFVMLPSSLNWYGQLHKDGYSIAGMLLVLITWVRLIEMPATFSVMLCSLALYILGLALIGIVRPYYLTLFLPATLGLIILIFFFALLKREFSLYAPKLLIFSCLLAPLFFGVLQTKEQASRVHADSTTTSLTLLGGTTSLTSLSSTGGMSAKPKKWNWQPSSWLPAFADRYVFSASLIRAQLISHSEKKGAGSLIDGDMTPSSAYEAIVYLPRALQIGMFAPFPTEWFSDTSLLRLLAASEMLIIYLCLPGLLILLLYGRSTTFLLSAYLSLTFLVVLSFTIANMGTLFRVRYLYICLLSGFGILGWLLLFDRLGLLSSFRDRISRRYDSENFLFDTDVNAKKNVKNDRRNAFGATIYVFILTFLSFLGFFFRDALMAQVYGLTNELDNFFIALLVPMTLVTIVCVPLGAAFTPGFIKATQNLSHESVRILIRRMSTFITLGLFCLCILLFVGLPLLLPFITNSVDSLMRLSYWALLILFFSGALILGNTVLNAMGKVVVTGMAQLIVPVIAICAIFIPGFGVEMVLFGMIVGQFINLLLIQTVLVKQGYSLLPTFDIKVDTLRGELLSQYFPLAVSAFFMSAILLINTLLAMSLPEGNASIFSLGNKVMLLVTGLVGAAISTVMLPYFSKLFAQSQALVAKHELSLALILLTCIFVPLGVFLFVSSEFISSLIFERGEVTYEDARAVSQVMKYAVVQIPFFACNVLLLKYATATKHVLSIVLSALIALCVNVVVSLLLMKFMGVSGIALGSSISMMLSTFLLVAMLARYHHIMVLDMTVLLLTWLLYLSLLLCLYFENLSGVILVVITCVFLALSYCRALISNRNSAGVQVREHSGVTV